MHNAQRSTNNTQGVTVKERFDALFASCAASGGDSLETMFRRNARIIFTGSGSIVITTPYYDARSVNALKRLGARGRKIGPGSSTRFEWTIPLSQLEELRAHLTVSMRYVDGFLKGVERAKRNQAIVDADGFIEHQDLYGKVSAPVPGEIYKKLKAIHVCIRHEATTLRNGSCVMVIYRRATKDEAACFIRTDNQATMKLAESGAIVSAA